MVLLQQGDLLADGHGDRVCTEVSRDYDDLGNLRFFMWDGGGLRLGSRRLPKVGGERLKGKRKRKTSRLRRFRYMVV